MTTQAYKTKVYRQLHNQQYYKPLAFLPKPFSRSWLNYIKKGCITNQQLKYLKPDINEM